jgi:hypothetical protein
MHATERPAQSPGPVAAAQPVAEVVLVLEEQLPEIRQFPETDLPTGDALRVECGTHLAEEIARLRSLREAQLVTAHRQALRFPRRVHAEGRRSGERRAVGAPRCGLVARRAPARGNREAQTEQDRRARRSVERHGTKSFGSRESDVRKTRTLARPFSSSAR